VDFEGIGMGEDGMSGDSVDVSFVVALVMVVVDSSYGKFYSFRNFSADVFLSNDQIMFLQTFPRRWVSFSLITEQATSRASQTPSRSLVILSIGSHHRQTLMMQQ